MKKLLLAFALIGFIATSSYASSTELTSSSTIEFCDDDKACDKKDCKHDKKATASKKECKKGDKKTCCASKKTASNKKVSKDAKTADVKKTSTAKKGSKAKQ